MKTYLKIPLSFMSEDPVKRERFLKDLVDTEGEAPSWALSHTDLENAEIVDEPE